jgi:ElaB/YqjD/DUF883 family membrane-anchored ribosome-binding protein
MPTRKELVALFAVASLTLPVAACGEDDVSEGADSARDEIREQASDLEGNLDDLSKQDLREALDDTERTAEEGGTDAKREARELKRKIERELESRE